MTTTRLTRLLCSLCFAAAAPAGADDARQDAATTLAAATVLHQQVVEAGHEWLGTRKLLEDARQALAKGDAARAADLSRQALDDCRRALEQARSEEVAWVRRVLR